MIAAAVLILDILLFALGGLAGLLGFIAVLVSLTFVLARLKASPRPAGLGGPAAAWMAWPGEIAAAWSIFLLAMPLERWLMPRDRAGAGADGTAPPVLLVHGYVNNAGALWRLWKALVDKGWRVHTLNLEPVYTDIDRYAERIAARVAEVRARTGAPAVTLVCHSMGGLAARAYLRHCARAGVEAGLARVVTLGTPHHGTVHARIEWSPNGRQMVPDSAWLRELGAFERERAAATGACWPCPLVSVYSFDDNIVAPQLSAHLEGARNLALAGIGHMSLPLSARAIDRVLAEISAGPALPA